MTGRSWFDPDRELFREKLGIYEHAQSVSPNPRPVLGWSRQMARMLAGSLLMYPLFDPCSLEELRLNRNVISDLPEVLGHLGRLRILTGAKDPYWDKGSLLMYPLFDPCSLEELRLDRNVISDLPEALGRLGRLRILTIGYNCLQELPSFLLVMRALALLDFQGNRVDNEKLPPAPAKDEASLARINLRANLLKGNIVLGNYGVSQPGLKLMSLR
uniref:Leucine-rich repeat domain-containing protein n=1 Tax=Timema cristinae TaxID=61476 RepID=A0A7R9CWW8_TIMCR|nr:unnamed protein product [Timema cristinae]